MKIFDVFMLAEETTFWELNDRMTSFIGVLLVEVSTEMMVMLDIVAIRNEEGGTGQGGGGYEA